VSVVPPLYLVQICATHWRALMPDHQQKDGHQSPRPQLQVRIRSEETEPITVHPATPDSLNKSSATAADKEKTGPNAFNGGNKATETSPAKSIAFWHSKNLPPTLQWIPANWSWSKWKPVLRSALAAWIGLLLFLIPTTLNVMGQVSFFRSCFPCA
jgi:hypothetical protein